MSSGERIAPVPFVLRNVFKFDFQYFPCGVHKKNPQHILAKAKKSIIVKGSNKNLFIFIDILKKHL